MTANQMERKIKTLREADSLSPANQRLLRQLESSLSSVIAEETKRKDQRAKLATYGESQPVRREPQDDGLSGAAWVNFYNRYCDPKRLAPATLNDSPATIQPRKKSKELNVAIPFPVNGRRVVLVQNVPAGKLISLAPDRKSKTNSVEVPEWRRAAAKKAWETMRAKRAAVGQVAVAA